MKQRITHASNVGRLTALIGLLLLALLLVLPFFPEDAPFAAAFRIPGIASILVGLALCLCPPARPLTMQEAMHHGNLLVLYSAEGHPDKLMPTLRETVRTIVLMYMAFLAVGVGAYVLCGMPVFDAVLHTMGALSTGGFSNQPESIGAYHSVAIEGVTIVPMLVGTTNFAILLLLVRRKWRDALRCSELRFLGALLAVFAPVTALVLVTGLYMSLGEGCVRRCLTSSPRSRPRVTRP